MLKAVKEVAHYKEQVSNQEIGGAGVKKFAKREMNRAMRRKARRDPENAPRKKSYYGYIT
ncbi:MAG: hypothetical protein HZA35_03990 [Parcubacteria group bacterium]|nr:hypothetical protein [Parcubacteria group bacterium]